MPNVIRDDLHRIDETSFGYIFEENATIELQDGRGIVRCNVYRPRTSTETKYPVLVTYGPYGKDVHYSVYVRPQIFPREPFNLLSEGFMLLHSTKCLTNIIRHIPRGRRLIRVFGLETVMR
jgi:hypothetical protein